MDKDINMERDGGSLPMLPSCLPTTDESLAADPLVLFL